MKLTDPRRRIDAASQHPHTVSKPPITLDLVAPDDPRPQPPEAPLPSDCCDSGCPICVHDLYADELRDYRERLARWLERHPGQA